MGLIVLSAVAFGAMAIFARFAYASGADVLGILIARFVIAGTVLSIYMIATRRPWPRGRPLAVMVAMGGIGYVGQSVSYFAALNHAAAGLVALLLYAYPTLVCLLAAAFLRQPLTPRTIAVLVVSFVGIALTLGGGEGSATGIALGLAAAAFYSVYIVVGARELAGTDALSSTTVVCLSAAVTLCMAGLFREPRFPVDGAGWAAIMAIALISTVLAIVAFFAGLKRVGAATASIVSTLEPVVTVTLAWALLGESLTGIQLCGGALVLGAAAWLGMGTTAAGPRRIMDSAEKPPAARI